MAAHAEIFRMSSFWRYLTARCAARMSETSRSRPSTDSFTRARWSLTSRKKGCAFSFTNGTGVPAAPEPESRVSGTVRKPRPAGTPGSAA